MFVFFINYYRGRSKNFQLNTKPKEVDNNFTAKPTSKSTISIAKQAKKSKVLLDDDAEDVEKTKKAIFDQISEMMARDANHLRRVVPAVKKNTTKKPGDTDKKVISTAKSKVSHNKAPTAEIKSSPKPFIVATDTTKSHNVEHNKFASSKNAESSVKVVEPRTTFKSTTSAGKQAKKLKKLFKGDAENDEETKESYLSDAIARDASDQGRFVTVIIKNTTKKPEVTTRSATVAKTKVEMTTRFVKNVTTAVASTKLSKNTTKTAIVKKNSTNSIKIRPHIVLPAYLYI